MTETATEGPWTDFATPASGPWDDFKSAEPVALQNNREQTPEEAAQQAQLTRPVTEDEIAKANEAAAASVPTTWQKIKKIGMESLIPADKVKEYSEKAAGMFEGSSANLAGAALTAISPATGLLDFMDPKAADESRAELARKSTELAATFVSPVGIATLGLGALPKAAQLAVGTGFAADLISHSPELADAIMKAETPKEKTSAIFDAATSAAMVAGIGKHLGGRPGKGGPFAEGRKEPYMSVGSKDIDAAIERTIKEVADSEPPPVVAEAPPPTATPAPVGIRSIAPGLAMEEGPPLMGEIGKTHEDILKRAKQQLDAGEISEEAYAKVLDAFADDTKHVFAGPDKQPLTRDQTETQYGFRSSQQLREKQAATAETTAPPQTPPTPEPPATAKAVEGPVDSSGRGKQSAAQLNERIDVLISRHKLLAESGDAAAASELWEKELKPLSRQLSEAEGQSMGPGAASAEEFIKQRELGAKNASVDAQRKERGQEPLMSQSRGTNTELWDQAQAEIARDENFAAKVVDDVIAGEKQSISDVEQQALLHEMVKLTNERDLELQRAGDDFSTPSERAAANKRAAELEERLSLTEAANRRAGTLSSSALRIRQQMVRDDFTPAGVERVLRAKKGAALTPDEIKYATEVSEKILAEMDKADKAAIAEIDKQLKSRIESDLGLSKSIDKRVLEYASKVVQQWEKDAAPARERLRRKYAVLRATAPEPNPIADLRDMILVAKAWIGRNGLKSAEFSAEMVKDFGEKIEPLVQKAWDAANEQLNKLGTELPERRRKAVRDKIKNTAGSEAERKSLIAGVEAAALENPSLTGPLNKYIKLLYRNFAESGMRGVDNITAAVKNILEPMIPGVTERQIMEAASDYGISRPAPTEAAKVHLSQIRGEMQKILQLEDIIEKQQAPKPTGQQRVPQSDYARRLTKLVNEAKKKYNIQPADPTRALRSALDARKTYYRNRLTDLKFEIGKRERIVKEKSSPPTDPELEALKAEYEELRSQHDEIFGEKTLTDEQRIAIAIKATERAEAAAKATLENARKGIFPGRKVGPSSPHLEAAKARVSAIRAEVQELREMSDAFKQQQESKRIEATEKQIAELDRKIKEGDIAAKEQKTSPMSPEREALVSQRDAMRSQLNEMRRAAMPKKTPEEIALASYKARLARQEADLLDKNTRADAGDATAFETPKRKPLDISKSPDLVRSKANVEKLKSDLNRKANEYALRNRTAGKRIVDGIGQTFDASKNIVASFDLSAPRQASLAIMGRPIIGFRNVWDMLRAFSSETTAREINQKIKERPNATNGLDKAAKIEYSELDQSTFTKREENARSVLDDWAQLPFKTGNAAKTVVTAIPKAISKGVRISNRAFITFLNKMRSDLFDAYLEANFKDRAPTTVELEAIGNLVNVLTGRGKLNPKTASVAAKALWAPKLLASRVQFLAGQPLYGGTARTRALVAKEYARILVGGYVLYNAAQMFSDKDEKDPRSSDFGKIVIGDIRLDPWGGLQQVAVLTSRMATGETKSAKGNKVSSIRGDIKYGQANAYEILSNFVRTKLNPPVGTAVDIITGQNVVGEKLTAKDVAVNLTVPLGFRDIAAVMEQEGIPKTIVLQILSSFGMGLAVYEDREKVNRP
jgi:hypothetical protein